MLAEDLLLLCGQELGRTEEQMRPIISAIVQEAWCETVDSLRELSAEQWAQLTYADATGTRQPLPARLVARIQQQLNEELPPSDHKTSSSEAAAPVSRIAPHGGHEESSIGDVRKLSSDYLKTSQTRNQTTAYIDDDDRSTAVPSDVLEENASEITTWDTGNLEDLSSCNVLSAAEIRAARLQRMARESKAQQGVSTGVAGKGSRAGVSRPKPARAQGTPSVTHKASINDSAAKIANKATTSRSAVTTSRPQSAAAMQGKAKQAAEKTKTPEPEAQSKGRPVTGDDLKHHLDKASRETIRDMGLWEYMPARNPVVTCTTALGADWNTSFQDYQHTLGGVPDAKPVERPAHVDDIGRQLDKVSREALKEMGLWEHMPARNPVITGATAMGSEWHVGFGEFQHTLGGVPDPRPVARPQKADEIHRQLDKTSRETIKGMGLWEYAPAKNPVITKTSTKGGSSWNVNFA